MSDRSDAPSDRVGAQNGGSDAPPRGMTARRIWMVALPFAITGVGVAGCIVLQQTQSKPEKKIETVRPPAVFTATAEAVTLRLRVRAQGEVRPKQEAQLTSQVSGRIAWISPRFAAGARVARGQVLARLDEADYRLSVVQQEARVAQARQGLIREEAEAALARQDWAELGRGEASPLALREPQLAEARAALAAAQAGLEEARLALQRTAIVAPFEGRVRERMAAVGQFVGPGASVGSAFATDAAEVRLPLTDADLAALGLTLGFTASRTQPGPGAVLQATIGGAPRTWDARLVRTEAALDGRTRQAFAVVEAPAPFAARHPQPLAPGLFVDAVIEAARSETFIRIPRVALRKADEVLVVSPDGRLDVRQVRPTWSDESGAYFRSGLKPGEQVVISALSAAAPGQKVSVTRPGAGAGQAPESPAAASAATARPATGNSAEGEPTP
jgi:RND family efflux transporter MFP subunit